jgi:hypothetical protein
VQSCQDFDLLHPSAVLQVEFYFSDSNVPRDNFLQGKMRENPEVRL